VGRQVREVAHTYAIVQGALRHMTHGRFTPRGNSLRMPRSNRVLSVFPSLLTMYVCRDQCRRLGDFCEKCYSKPYNFVCGVHPLYSRPFQTTVYCDLTQSDACLSDSLLVKRNFPKPETFHPQGFRHLVRITDVFVALRVSNFSIGTETPVRTGSQSHALLPKLYTHSRPRQRLWVE
jgi:hypothetical protein